MPQAHPFPVDFKRKGRKFRAAAIVESYLNKTTAGEQVLIFEQIVGTHDRCVRQADRFQPANQFVACHAAKKFPNHREAGARAHY